MKSPGWNVSALWSMIRRRCILTHSSDSIHPTGLLSVAEGKEKKKKSREHPKPLLVVIITATVCVNGWFTQITDGGKKKKKCFFFTHLVQCMRWDKINLYKSERKFNCHSWKKKQYEWIRKGNQDSKNKIHMEGKTKDKSSKNRAVGALISAADFMSVKVNIYTV